MPLPTIPEKPQLNKTKNKTKKSPTKQPVQSKEKPTNFFIMNFPIIFSLWILNNIGKKSTNC